ncbi:MAG: AMP-binding protein [Actinomycetota bacterium]
MTRWRAGGSTGSGASPGRERALEAWAAEGGSLEWASAPRGLYESGPEPYGHWFPGGTLNVAANCLDRHLAERGDRVAFHWEGEPGDRRALTYRELHAEVAKFSAVLARLGVGRGDRVALYLGMVPEAIVAMLACARLGAVHCVLFTALPAEALADRLGDLEPKVLVTQDGGWRHGVVLPLKARADEALAATSGSQHTVVVRRTGIDVAWYEGDRWYDELMAEVETTDQPAEPHPADDPLLVIHLANRRGRPTRVVHRAAGLLVHASAIHRGLSTSVDDVFWCAVDIGWLAGQTHGVYGALAVGATSVAFEGTLDTPTHARAWQIIDRYDVNALVTTPSVLRSLRQWEDSPPSVAKLDSLRLIVHAGEPLDDDTRVWLRDEVGRGQALLRDGWGQTELGGIVAVAPPPDPPVPDPGLDVLADDGTPVGLGEVGELVLCHPWPASFLHLQHHDAGRYWRRPGYYATGDLARRETDGTISVLGRIDPVLSVSGQLVSAGEVRDVLEEHPYVAAAEVVARADRRSGQAVAACVVLDTSAAGSGAPPLQQLAADLRVHVRETIGGLAQPQVVAFCEELPSDLSQVRLRHALTALCSSGRPGDVIRVTRDQLRAAVAASTPRV